MPTTNNRPSANPESRQNIPRWGEIRNRVIRAQGRYMARTGKAISTREFIVYMLKSFLEQDERKSR